MTHQRTPVTDLHRYMTYRAEKERQPHSLTEEFYMDRLASGVRDFFGVIVNSDGEIQRDEQNSKALAAWHAEEHR